MSLCQKLIFALLSEIYFSFIHLRKIPHTFSFVLTLTSRSGPVAQYVIDVSLVMDSDEQPSEIIME